MRSWRPGFEMAFHHDAAYARIAAGDLFADVVADGHLFGRILAAVVVAAINHDARRYARFGEILRGGIDVGAIVIRLFAAAQNDVAVLVAGGRNDGRMARLGDG